MDRIEECGTNEGMPMVPPMPQEDKGNPVSMNVSLNASGKDHVEDLINMMKNAGMGGAKEVAPDMMPMRTDMERLRDIVDGPKDMDDLKPGMQKEPCPKCGKQHIVGSNCMDSIEMDDEAVEEGQYDGKSREELLKMKDQAEADIKNFQDKGGDDPTGQFLDDTVMMQMQQHLKDIEAALEKVGEGYDNEPDEQYGSIDDVIDTGNDLHKSKKAYAATQDGDNPMALEDDIKEQLYKAIQAKMAEGRGRGKKKAKEDIQTTEGRGRGKSKKVKEGECPKCGKPGKKKLMACSSCGCS